jgi:hypothetical protein
MNRRIRRAGKALVLLAAFLILLTACSDGGGPSPAASGEPGRWDAMQWDIDYWG